MSKQLTPKQKIIFRERKKRYIGICVENLQNIGKSLNPRQTSFDNIRTALTDLEILHSDSGKSWLGAERIFWEKYDIDRFLEKTQLCTKAHMIQCKSGLKSYSERMKDAILCYMKDSEL